MNPSLPEEIVANAYADDPVIAASEWGGEFRRDLEPLFSREALDAAIVRGRCELPPMRGVRYTGFVDPSGGSADAMTLAIAHTERDVAVLDAIRERRPPFSPDAVVQEFGGLLRAYGLNVVSGDRYAGVWPVERFRAQGVLYWASEKTKANLYLTLLPVVNSGRVELLDDRRLQAQFAALERRTSRGGRDVIDHPPHAHDDIANAAAGALVNALAQRAVRIDPRIWRVNRNAPRTSSERRVF